ncbi:MAG: hypothetical protein HZY75_06350 [Nocardioidaceae bacterium]|nr:MAG: hypothetical protein HZY75_06350 [Nocardioidaceae bacterium]
MTIFWIWTAMLALMVVGFIVVTWMMFGPKGVMRQPKSDSEVRQPPQQKDPLSDAAENDNPAAGPE